MGAVPFAGRRDLGEPVDLAPDRHGRTRACLLRKIGLWLKPRARSSRGQPALNLSLFHQTWFRRLTLRLMGASLRLKLSRQWLFLLRQRSTVDSAVRSQSARSPQEADHVHRWQTVFPQVRALFQRFPMTVNHA